MNAGHPLIGCGLFGDPPHPRRPGDSPGLIPELNYKTKAPPIGSRWRGKRERRVCRTVLDAVLTRSSAPVSHAEGAVEGSDGEAAATSPRLGEVNEVVEVLSRSSPLVLNDSDSGPTDTRAYACDWSPVTRPSRLPRLPNVRLRKVASGQEFN